MSQISDDVEDDAFDWAAEEPDTRAVVAELIGAMDRFAEPLPLTAALRPYTNVYAPDMVYPAVVLTDLFADRPSEGAGSAYMSELTTACEKAGLTLYTDAQNDRSRDFYLARGFEITAGRRDHQLVRWPSAPETPASEADEEPSP